MDYLQSTQPCVGLALKSANAGEKATRADSAGMPRINGASPLSRSGERSGSPASAPTPLIEIAAITARGLAGQPMKRGTEPAGVAEANIERNRGDGQFAI